MASSLASCALRLGDGGLVGAGVDLKQELALLDGLAFVEIDLQQLAVDAAVQRDGVVRGDRAERGEVDRNGLLSARRGEDRGGAVGGLRGFGSCVVGRFWLARMRPDGKDDGADDDSENDDHAQPAAAG